MAKPEELPPESQDAVNEVVERQEDASTGNVTPIKKDDKPDIFKKEDPKLMEKMRGFVAKLGKIKSERSELNAESNEVMAKLENLGFSKKGCKAAIAYLSLNDKDRINFDLSYAYLRKACGEPVQDDLFIGAVASELRDK
jgi:uncharacterized protein (UPF0335 family)